jgi:uncharacterized protein YaeQ
MALSATPLRFNVVLSHVDRGVYAELELKMAKHPSETTRYLLCRLIAYCALYEEGLAFSKGGLSAPDEPTISLRSPDGRLLLHVEIGAPSAQRLHRASKAAARLAVFTHHDPALLVSAVRGEKVHRLEAIEVYALAPSFLDAVAEYIGERGAALELTITDGQLYLGVAGQSFSTPLACSTLDAISRSVS